jgi:hypothetical protein
VRQFVDSTDATAISNWIDQVNPADRIFEQQDRGHGKSPEYASPFFRLDADTMLLDFDEATNTSMEDSVISNVHWEIVHLDSTWTFTVRARNKSASSNEATLVRTQARANCTGGLRGFVLDWDKVNENIDLLICHGLSSTPDFNQSTASNSAPLDKFLTITWVRKNIGAADSFFVYIDGVLESEFEDTGAHASIELYGSETRLAALGTTSIPSGVINVFDGDMTDIALHNRALSPTEVMDIHNLLVDGDLVTCVEGEDAAPRRRRSLKNFGGILR